MTTPLDSAYGAERYWPPDSDVPNREVPDTARVGEHAGTSMRCVIALNFDAFLLRIFHYLSIGFIGFSLDFVF
jgi:hypothetical protein